MDPTQIQSFNVAMVHVASKACIPLHHHCLLHYNPRKPSLTAGHYNPLTFFAERPLFISLSFRVSLEILETLCELKKQCLHNHLSIVFLAIFCYKIINNPFIINIFLKTHFRI